MEISSRCIIMKIDEMEIHRLCASVAATDPFDAIDIFNAIKCE